MEFHQINIYRLTHIENIPHILKHGITHKCSPYRNPDYKDIGDKQIIATRVNKKVNITNGESGLSYRWITLGDYIPFYFGVRMPMLYVSQIGGNFVEKATPNENIVYLVCNVKSLSETGDFTFYFSNGSAVNNLTVFFDAEKLLKLPQILDWEAIKSTRWDGFENLDRKLKKQAEFLIKEDIPLENIIGFVCYNEVAKNNLIKMGINPELIKIHTKSYF